MSFITVEGCVFRSKNKIPGILYHKEMRVRRK